MRRFIILCLLLFASLAAQARSYRAEDIPNVQRADRTRYVSNPDGILSPGAVARIDSVCGALRDRAIAQVAVVAVDDIAGGDVFDFAVDLFTQWGVGRAENDNGLGILLAFIYQDNRAFCKYLCPITVFLKPMSYFALIRVKCDESKCISCGKCRKVCPMEVDMLDPSKRRKNGTECILCLECKRNCPVDAL